MCSNNGYLANSHKLIQTWARDSNAIFASTQTNRTWFLSLVWGQVSSSLLVPSLRKLGFVTGIWNPVTIPGVFPAVNRFKINTKTTGEQQTLKECTGLNLIGSRLNEMLCVSTKYSHDSGQNFIGWLIEPK